MSHDHGMRFTGKRDKVSRAGVGRAKVMLPARGPSGPFPRIDATSSSPSFLSQSYHHVGDQRDTSVI